MTANDRTLVIRIAAITLASDSAITIARFRPSKVQRGVEDPTSSSDMGGAMTSCSGHFVFRKSYDISLREDNLLAKFESAAFCKQEVFF